MHSSIKRNDLVCFPSPQTSISPFDKATFLQIAAGTFSFPSYVPSGPNML